MQKWEYQTEAFSPNRDIEEALNQIGEGGWELVVVYMNGAGNNVFIFKRPKR